MKNFSNMNCKQPKLTKVLKQCLRKSVVLGLGGLLAFSTFNVSASDYQRAQKELRIMSKIFDTSLSDANIQNKNRVFPGRTGSTKSTYLAKQGMVFTFGFSSSEFGSSEDWQAFGEGVGRLVGTIASEVSEAFADIDSELNQNSRLPRAPRAPIADNNWEDNIEAYEAYQEAMEDMRDEQRELREDVRETQRNIRDLEREARRDSENADELKQSREELAKKLEKLTGKKQAYEQKMKEYREKKQQKTINRNNKKSDIIIATLCDYGTTLRSLSDDEHVTLIFNNFKNGKDQIFVFESDDIKDCSNKDKLLKKGISYQI